MGIVMPWFWSLDDLLFGFDWVKSLFIVQASFLSLSEIDLRPVGKQVVEVEDRLTALEEGVLSRENLLKVHRHFGNALVE